MRVISTRLLISMLGGVLLAGCGVQMGDESARTPVTGSAGGATSHNAKENRTLDHSLGTLLRSKTRRRPGTIGLPANINLYLRFH